MRAFLLAFGTLAYTFACFVFLGPEALHHRRRHFRGTPAAPQVSARWRNDKGSRFHTIVRLTWALRKVTQLLANIQLKTIGGNEPGSSTILDSSG